MAQERASEIILRVVSLLIASFAVLVSPAALAQVTIASRLYPSAAMSEQQHASSSTLKPPLFLPAVTYDSGGAPSSVALGDVNGDGKLDLVVTNLCVRIDNYNCPNGSDWCVSIDYCAYGTVGVLLGNGDGTFQPALTSDSVGYLPQSVALGDVNGDGKLDVVVANSCENIMDCSNGAVSVMFGNGDGTLGPLWSYSSAGWWAVSVAVGDVNSDGTPDLLVADTCSTNPTCDVDGCECTTGLVVVLGAGHSYGSGGPYARSVALADVNGDGAPDLLVANDNSVGVLLGNGDGTFQSALAYGAWRARSVAVGDVNVDGKPDLLVARRTASSLSAVGVLLGNGDGTFQPAITYDSGGYQSFSVAVGDVNGDGKPDLVTANQFGAQGDNRAVGVLLGNGDGTFQPAVVFSSGDVWVTSVAVGDLNADAKPDLVLANGSNVGVLLNNTSFCTTPPMITLSTTPAALWPPNGKTVPVTVSGTITDTGCTVTAAAYSVTDEYGKVQPSGPVTLSPEGAYSFTVLLEASRLGADIDGRVYTVTVGASNDASKTGSEARTVIVPHDQGH